MKLKLYLIEHDLTASAFAKAIGVAPSTVTRILRGERRPDIDTLSKIEDATRGLVTIADFPSPKKKEENKTVSDLSEVAA